MAWGKKSKQTNDGTQVREAQVKRIKDARTANETAHQRGDGGSKIRSTAAIYQRAVANASPAELAASED